MQVEQRYLKEGNTIISPVTSIDSVYADDVGGGYVTLLDKIYPVGSIYQSTEPTNPSILFGIGTWEHIKDRFLLGVGDTYTEVNKIGGEATHTLTVVEMPSHNHSGAASVSANYSSRSVEADNTGKNAVWPCTSVNVSSGNSGANGGNGAHNNMPPYITVYIWKRVS